MEKLYHGTDLDSAKAICDAQTVDLSVGSKRSDFGQGFYVSDSYDGAVDWARRKARVRGKSPAVVTVVFDVKGAEAYIERFSDDLRWGRFIINNRNGLDYIKRVPFQEHNLDARYPITFGRISDVSIRNVAKTLGANGKMLTSLEDILNISFPFQYAFHTKEAVEFIKKFSYRSV